MAALPSPSPSAETRTSAGGALAAAVAVAVVIVLGGITKYRPIARRTAAFAMPPPPNDSPDSDDVVVGVIVGSGTDTRWLGIGEYFLYYIHIAQQKTEEKLSSTYSRDNEGRRENVRARYFFYFGGEKKGGLKGGRWGH